MMRCGECKPLEDAVKVRKKIAASAMAGRSCPFAMAAGGWEDMESG